MRRNEKLLVTFCQVLIVGRMQSESPQQLIPDTREKRDPRLTHAEPNACYDRLADDSPSTHGGVPRFRFRGLKSEVPGSGSADHEVRPTCYVTAGVPGSVFATYERDAIVNWLRKSATDPITGCALKITTVWPDKEMRSRVEAFYAS